MDIEEARKRIKYLIEDSCTCPECTKNKEAYETVLNYISELETRCKMQEYRIVEMDIPKQMIKDKIEELENKAMSYGHRIDRDESFNIQSKISVLIELLGE